MSDNSTSLGAVQKSRFQKHMSTYGFGRIIGILSQFITVLTLTRIGTDLYLRYSLVLAVAVAITSLTFGWTRQAMLRDARAGLSPSPQIQTGLLAVLGITAVMTGIGAALVLRQFSIVLAVSAAVFGGTFLLSQFYVSTAQASLLPGRSVRIESIRYGGTALLPITGHWAGIDVSLPLVLALASVSAVAAVAPELIHHTVTPARSLAADFRFGFPIAIWLLLSTLLQYTDRWILEIRVNTAAATEYAATYDLLARGATAVLVPVTLAAHPLMMSAANTSDSNELRAIFRGALRTSLLLATACVGGALTFALASTWIAPAASNDPLLAVTLALGGAAWQIALILHKPFEIKRRTTQMAIAMAIALTANILANWYLAPSGGVVIVAALNLAAVLLYVCILYVSRYFQQRSGADRW